MDFELVKPSRNFLHPQTFLKRLGQVSPDEGNYCVQLLRKASRNKTRLHLLVIPERSEVTGLIALSVSTLRPDEDVPCIVIDYLLAAIPYRRMTFQQLGNKRISEYLVEYAVEIAQETNSNIPFRYVALHPVHHKLIPLYVSLGFKPLDNSGWLFFKIAQ